VKYEQHNTLLNDIIEDEHSMITSSGWQFDEFFTNGFDYRGILFLHDQTADEEAKRSQKIY
jgi:hypothetical protein